MGGPGQMDHEPHHDAGENGDQGLPPEADGEDDVLGAIDGVGDADGAGEGAQRGFEATESFEGGGDVAVFFYQGGGAHVTFERTCATVWADGGVAFNGDIHLPDVAGGV